MQDLVHFDPTAQPLARLEKRQKPTNQKACYACKLEYERRIVSQQNKLSNLEDWAASTAKPDSASQRQFGLT